MRVLHLGLVACLFGLPVVASDSCSSDLSALNDLSEVGPLEGDDLHSVIDSLAHFELTELQDRIKPSSAIQGLRESFEKKIALVVKRSGLPEEMIRTQIREAKQRIFFGGAKKERDDPAKRELEKMAESSPRRFFLERVLPTDASVVALSPNGRRAIVGGRGASDVGFLEFWNLETQDSPKRISVEFVPQTMTFDPEGKTVAAAGGTVVRLWDPDTAVELSTLDISDAVVKTWHLSGVLPTSVSSIAMTAGGTEVAVGMTMDDVLIWNPKTDQIVEKIGVVDTGDSKIKRRITFIQIDPHGNWLFVVNSYGGSGAKLFVRDPADLWSHKLKRSKNFQLAHSWPDVTAASVLPGGRELFFVRKDGMVLLIGMNQPTIGLTLGKMDQCVLAKIAPEGKLALTPSMDGLMQLWDLEQKGPMQRIRTPITPTTFNGFLSIAEGRIAATDAAVNSVKIWNYRKPKPSELGLPD